MTTTSDLNQKAKLSRVRNVGYLLSFLGLSAGAFAMGQMWTWLSSVHPVDITLDWLVIEGVAGALFSSLGFLLLVLSTGHVFEQEQALEKTFDSHADQRNA